jgi:hypothetical protein
MNALNTHIPDLLDQVVGKFRTFTEHNHPALVHHWSREHHAGLESFRREFRQLDLLAGR